MVNVQQSVLKAPIRPCKVTPVGELGSDYETAFYAVSEAYISTSERIAKCNAQIKIVMDQLNKQGTSNDRTED